MNLYKKVLRKLLFVITLFSIAYIFFPKDLDANKGSSLALNQGDTHIFERISIRKPNSNDEYSELAHNWRLNKKEQNRILSTEIDFIQFGDIQRTTHVLENGTKVEISVGTLGSKEYGYAFDYKNHAYNGYSLDTLRGLSESYDRDAQMILANIFSRKKSTYEESNFWFIEAAKQGYVAGLDRVALNHFRLGNNSESEAYRILAANATSDLNGSVRKFYRKYFTDAELEEAKILAQTISEAGHIY